jgi:signal transduction histidine kinase
MIVEDEMIVAMDIQASLENFGYEVVGIASSGEEAIDKFNEQRPDIVLMDIKLNGEMFGFEAADQIRTRFDTPVIFLTAYADEQLLEKAKTTEPFGYIIKPFKDYELRANIEIALYKHKAEKALGQARRMEAVVTLASGIAHEFNNALTGITGNIELLRMKLPKDEIVFRNLEFMETSAQRMVHLTKQLLAYSQGGNYRPKILSLNELVKVSLPLIKRTIKPEIRIVTNLTTDIPSVKADPIQLQTVLLEAIRNAAEAVTERGSVTIITGKKDIGEENAGQFPDIRPDFYTSLTIKDDGNGMDEETRRRIFEPFSSTKFQGRGLGMAAAYGIVKNHGGWIGVDSKLGKGTIVRVFLPAVGS